MRTFLKIFARFAPVFAALCLIAMPSQAHAQIDIRIGGGFATSQVGSHDWAEARFIYNRRSAIITTALPYAAEHATTTNTWLAGDLAIPGLRTVQTSRGHDRWATRIGRYDVNFNVKVVSREETYSSERVRLSVTMTAYGWQLPRAGKSYTFTVYGSKDADGFWSFYPNTRY